MHPGFFFAFFLGFSMNKNKIQKIAVVGNAAGGKTTLSRSLARRLQLPLIHVDSIQFLPGLKLRPFQESKQILQEIESKDQWIIDGYGPLDLIENRFLLADKIIFIDWPLRRHQLWFLKRQLKNIFQPRAELPFDCNEITWAHTMKILKSMKSSHQQMRPELLKIFARENLKNKVIYVRSIKDLKKLECIESF